MQDIKPNSDRQQLVSETVAVRNDEETLVADSRASLTPSQMVEQKLIGRLQNSPLLISHVQRGLKPSRR